MISHSEKFSYSDPPPTVPLLTLSVFYQRNINHLITITMLIKTLMMIIMRMETVTITMRMETMTMMMRQQILRMVDDDHCISSVQEGEEMMKKGKSCHFLFVWYRLVLFIKRWWSSRSPPYPPAILSASSVPWESGKPEAQAGRLGWSLPIQQRKPLCQADGEQNHDHDHDHGADVDGDNDDVGVVGLLI